MFRPCLRPLSIPVESWFSRTFRAVWPCTWMANQGDGGFTSMVVYSVSSPLLSIVPAGLEISRVLPTTEDVTVEAGLARSAVDCPDCGLPSRRLHSHYPRVLHDLPWQGRSATIRVKARRFRCLNSACARKTFAERLGLVAPVSARRTARHAREPRAIRRAPSASVADNGTAADNQKPPQRSLAHLRDGAEPLFAPRSTSARA